MTGLRYARSSSAGPRPGALRPTRDPRQIPEASPPGIAERSTRKANPKPGGSRYG